MIGPTSNIRNANIIHGGNEALFGLFNEDAHPYWQEFTIEGQTVVVCKILAISIIPCNVQLLVRHKHTNVWNM